MHPFGTRLFHLLLIVVPVCAGCASVPRAPAVETHPGFDTSFYPGEEALRVWRQASPYEWIGYYLPAPCHRDSSWVGTRQTIERLGWGTAVLYVGQQLFEGDTTANVPGRPILCSRTLLTPEQGRTDALDAIRKAQAEGFPRGTTVFLDVERMSAVPPEMDAYYRAWVETVLADAYYEPGTYAHRTNAASLFATALAAFRRAGRTATPAFWVAGGSGFSLEQPPRASGHAFAAVWQGALHVTRTWGSVTLVVDENVSTRRSPSAPVPVVAGARR